MRTPILSKETWMFILVTALAAAVFFAFVDLSPRVDYDTFFASDDPTYQADVEISRFFPRSDSQIIFTVQGDIHSEKYQQKMKKFGDLLLEFEAIKDVKSIMHGPKSVDAALESPFWKRFLISGEGEITNVFGTFETDIRVEELPEIMPRIENLTSVFQNKDFDIKISGYPYIIDLIRRHLNRDLRIFTILAFAVFGCMIIFVFHSWRILLGMIIACLNAAALTLMVSNLLNIKIGILTANLTTIVFVLTLSHIVFLTFNWKHLYKTIDRVKAAKEAVKITLPASFWAMFTTLLGFISLLWVTAKPIKELGVSGAFGAVIAFLMAYCVYPSFLRLAAPAHERRDDSIQKFYRTTFLNFDRQKYLIMLVIFGIVCAGAPFLRSLNTDPGLISFFSKKSPITQGLKHVDKHGGSSPLIIVLKDADGEPLHTKKNIEKLWNLQRDLESNPNVGTTLSMPLLLDEARDASAFSFMLSNERLLKIMDKPKHGEIASSFITKDGKHTLFLMRMKEDGRKDRRLTVLKELRTTVRKNDLTPHLFGSVYALHGQISQQVATSLIFGLKRLVIVFAVIALLVSWSLRSTFAMTVSICAIPLCILGPIGMFNIPLDMITAPAANIAISMGIDAMIHMVHAYRRLNKLHPRNKENWQKVRKRMWEPIMTSMFIVASGFGIFFFSSFPPTQRFGGSIMWGTVVAAMCALFIFPYLARKAKPRVHFKAKPPAQTTPRISREIESTERDINLN